MRLKSSISDLLLDAGIKSEGVELQLINGGGNNKVFSVKTKDAKYLAKIYFPHPSDTRNRLAAEYSFLSYAFNIGLDCVPKPVFCNPEKNMGLYEFVNGRKLNALELTRQHIIEAACFIKGLNATLNRDQTLPIASEGCFSIEQHFSIIDNRLKRLLSLPVESTLERQAHSFVSVINSTWEKHKNKISTENRSIKIELRIEDRCISPSDFGFHNALLRTSGGICFIDFEYAGWDDPAKMVGDFFLQPAVPVSFEYFDDFTSEALGYSKNKAVLTERVNLLFPIFEIKWYCILLNEFLPEAAKRRQFANPEQDPEQSKRLQLNKAQRIFDSKKAGSWHI